MQLCLSLRVTCQRTGILQPTTTKFDERNIPSRFRLGIEKEPFLKYAQSFLYPKGLPSQTNNFTNDTCDLREVQLDNEVILQCQKGKEEVHEKFLKVTAQETHQNWDWIITV